MPRFLSGFPGSEWGIQAPGDAERSAFALCLAGTSTFTPTREKCCSGIVYQLETKLGEAQMVSFAWRRLSPSRWSDLLKITWQGGLEPASLDLQVEPWTLTAPCCPGPTSYPALSLWGGDSGSQCHLLHPCVLGSFTEPGPWVSWETCQAQFFCFLYLIQSWFPICSSSVAFNGFVHFFYLYFWLLYLKGVMFRILSLCVNIFKNV